MRGYKFFIPIEFLCLLFFGVSAHAACTGGPTNTFPTFNMGQHYVPRDAPIGSVIGTASVKYNHTYTGNIITCTIGETLEFRAGQPLVTGITMPQTIGLTGGSIMRTNIPGVGMVIRAPAWLSSTNVETIAGTLSFIPFTVSVPGPNFLLVNNPIEFEFTLIKVSNNIPVGTTPLINPSSMVGLASGGRRYLSIFVTGVVTRSECSVPPTSAIINVSMGDVPRRDFNGKDTFLESKSFVIPLINCVPGTYPTDQSWNFYNNSNANIKVEGAAGSSIVDASRGILGLTQASTAKGVGIQILLKDGVTPLELNKTVSVGPLTGSRLDIQLHARYIQTSTPATGPEPGTANARAAFTVTYK